MTPKQLLHFIDDYRYSQTSEMKARVAAADGDLLAQLGATQHEAVEGILVEEAFSGTEMVDTMLPKGEVPMDRVHGSDAVQGMIRARLMGEKLRGLPERKDPLLLDVLTGRRHGDRQAAIERASTNRVDLAVSHATNDESEAWAFAVFDMDSKQRQAILQLCDDLERRLYASDQEALDLGLGKLYAYPDAEDPPTLWERLRRKVASIVKIRTDP